MSIETLDYTIVFNEHTVTCFEVGSVPTIGYASIEDAMTGTNPVTVPESVFDAACALLDDGVRLTTIYAHVGEETWMQWDEEPEELTAIEGEESVRKLTLSRKQRRAQRRVQNKRHKQSDRQHGKRRADSAKNLRRWEDDRAQMERAQVMWHENNKGEYVPRPFQRSNRHNTHMSPEQEHLNLLKVGAQRVSVQDVNWAKAVVQNAAEEGQEWVIYDALVEQLDYCPTPEKEVTLLTVIMLSAWSEKFDGSIAIRLPATADCIDSISHNDWYKEAVQKKVPLVVEAWNENT